MPFYTNFARIWSVGVGIVPKWLVDFVQWLSAADFAMIDYGPKPDAAEMLLAEKTSMLEK
jgi:all-trans-retinol dehydrogenase (NAD+)